MGFKAIICKKHERKQNGAEYLEDKNDLTYIEEKVIKIKYDPFSKI
jgi:hypothetical protein